MSVYFQVLCTVIIYSLSFNMGLLITWPSPTLALFTSENTTLNRPMTETEIGLLGSLSSIGGLISNPATGYLLDTLGRKYSSIVSAMGVVISWAILVSCDRVEVVLAGVFTSGFSTIGCIATGIFCSEICKESIRGAVTSCNMASFGLGMLLSYLLGGCLEYHVMLYVGLTLSVGGVALLFLLKETPMHLMTLGKEKEAVQSIAFYKRLKPGSKEILEELNQIRRALNPNFDETPETERLRPDLKPKEKLSILQFLKKSRSTQRVLFVNMVITTASLFQGLVVLQVYAEQLFKETIPGVSPTVCSVAFAAVIVVSGFVSAYLMDRAGRRPLMIYSSVVVGICCVVLGTQIHLHWGPNWLTAVFIYIFPIAYTCGAGMVPFVLVTESFLPEIKSFASMVVMEWTWFCCFIMIYIFNPLLNLIGLGPVFYIFAAVCFFTSVFCVFFLPETKGLTVEAIQTLFDNPPVLDTRI